MVVVYSPHRDGGGIFHFPSPTSSPHRAPNSALEQLRQSLSRSPSKGPAFRLVSSKSSSPTPKSPLSPSPKSPSNRPEAFAIVTDSNGPDVSFVTSLFPSSNKKKRTNLRHLSPMRTPSRSLSGQRSPAKRALTDSSDNGNATPQPNMKSLSGIENGDTSQQSLAEKGSPVSGGSMPSSDENLLAPHHALSRKERQGAYFDIAAKSSPLKRSDASARFDLHQVSSPSAKRRSLHGASFGPDFNIFDQAALFEQTSPPQSLHDSTSQAPTSRDTLNPFSPVPRRSSSLRRTTLQQRYDASPARPKLNAENFLDASTPNMAAIKARNRLSLEFPVPHLNRDSPFSNETLPNASIHTAHQFQRDNSSLGNLPLPQRHPLSRTLTQSSSNSEFVEDSPTHAPVRLADARRPRPELTRSLPLGTLRPTQRIAAEDVSSEGGSFSTPENYKLAKPLPAAFMSTGLISKKNRTLDNEQLDFSTSIGHMPDTPCKRPTSMTAMHPVPTPSIDLHKSRQTRHTLPSFGTPSKLVNPHTSRPSVLNGKGTSIFGSGFNKGISRRGSFAGSDFEDELKSPLKKFENRRLMDLDGPPTPTKQVQNYVSPDLMDFESNDPPRSPQSGPENDRCIDSPKPNNDCKSISVTGEKAAEAGDVNNHGDNSTSRMLRCSSLDAIPTFSKRPHAAGRTHCPAPLAQTSLSLPLISKHAKQGSVSAASPTMERQIRYSPRTPLETMVPPDPSGLSISAHGSKTQAPRLDSRNANTSLVPPATPTANRDSLGRLGSFGASVTPVHYAPTVDVDSSITSRFEKVEPTSTGEFSHVFRVSRPTPITRGRTGLFSPFGRVRGREISPGQAWAVKKTKKPYTGSKDRERKFQEVQILRALGKADHTIHYVDCWEFQAHLYIQTEYCEEGSLDGFLVRAGQNARLDDFRIWKIMLELSLVRFVPSILLLLIV